MNRRSFLKAVVAVAAFPSAVLSRVRAPEPEGELANEAIFIMSPGAFEQIIRDDYARAFAEREDQKFLTGNHWRES